MVSIMLSSGEIHTLWETIAWDTPTIVAPHSVTMDGNMKQKVKVYTLGEVGKFEQGNIKAPDHFSLDRCGDPFEPVPFFVQVGPLKRRIPAARAAAFALQFPWIAGLN
jgi:hypothetical protein